MSKPTLEQLDDAQRDAVNRCLDMTRRCVAVTGEAGSGKTTIIEFVYNSLIAAGYTGAVCAPTGKAAKRIREATGIPATTIHKLLEFTSPIDLDPKTGRPYGITFPKRNAQTPLDVDFVIGDEYAMVPRALHRSLIEAMPKNGCRLLTFGDDQQLPPIEDTPEIKNGKPVSAFSLLVDKFGIRLNQSHRQADNSDVLHNAHRIRAGMMVQNRERFSVTTSDDVVKEVLKLLGEADYAALNNQIITPANISWIGAFKLNQAIQAHLWADKGLPDYKPPRWFNKHTNKGAPEIVLGVGDKVIITRNQYMIECSDGSKGVFNGETGIITEITDLDEVVIDLGDRVARIPMAIQIEYDGKVRVDYPQRDIDLAYAITTHKAQGSEYENVIVVLGRSVFRMLNRRNLYTAVTRARNSVRIITDATGLKQAIKQAEAMEWK